MITVKIDDEFKSLIPPLETNEYIQLEQNILNDTIRDPLVLWDGVLIDGHNRYEIAQKHGLGYRTINKDFEDRESAKLWIIDNQLGRRNINDYCKTTLGLMKEDILKEQAKERQGARTDIQDNIVQKSAQCEENKTRNIIAKETGVSHDTVDKVKRINENAVPELKEKLKSSEVSINAGDKIAKEKPETQKQIIDRIESDGDKSVTQVYREVKREERRAEIEIKEQELPTDTYRVIYADPPWNYGNSGLDEYGHAERHYPTMTIEELCDMPIKEKTATDAVLFLWVTSPMLEDSFKVIKSWGFKYKSSFVWDKVKHNFGYYNSVRHEFLLIATKGSCTPDEKKLHDSVQEIERSGEHSEKPEHFRGIIDQLYSGGKRLELFARRDSDGWKTWGNE